MLPYARKRCPDCAAILVYPKLHALMGIELLLLLGLEDVGMGERSNTHPDVEYVIGLIRRSFEGKRTIEVKNLKSGTFTATLVDAGIEVSNLGQQPFLPWDVFTETVGLLRENGGKALKGDAMSSRLGEVALPIDSVEGRVAFRVYGKGAGESVFRRITPIVNILVHASICMPGRGKYLELKTLPNTTGIETPPSDRTSVESLVEYCREHLELEHVTDREEYSYQSLSLCVIDAVFSIGVKYEGTRNVVQRYCNHFNLPMLRQELDGFPPRHEQESITSFVNRMEELGIEFFTTNVFRNKQRTSSRSGILKTEAVLRFARALKETGVDHFQDVESAITERSLEERVRSIPGQRSGISLQYFFMLSGSSDRVKPDRMIKKFILDATHRPIPSDERIQQLLREVTARLREDYPAITPRRLDSAIWNFVREQK